MPRFVAGDEHRGVRSAPSKIPGDLREEGEDISSSQTVEKAEIVATLRSRGQDSRADWVDRQLPEHIDTTENAALLRTLGIEVATPTIADPVR
jgi:hypothetical protein